MRILLGGAMLCLLLFAPEAMDAASAACRLFVTAVLPGLFPYMVLSLLLLSRFPGRKPPGLLMLLGWGGGSPTGARLLSAADGLPRRVRLRLAVTTATMSPMFLLGTCGAWLGSLPAGMVLLGSVLAGGWLTGLLAGVFGREHMSGDDGPCGTAAPEKALTFGGAVEQAARTMLLVCGTMVMLRVLASLSSARLAALGMPRGVTLALTALTEVTTGVQAIAALPWPLLYRTALIAGATGFGGMAILLQNRASYPADLLSFPQQLALQALHGGLSFLLALGMMHLLG